MTKASTASVPQSAARNLRRLRLCSSALMHVFVFVNGILLRLTVSAYIFAVEWGSKTIGCILGQFS